MNWLTPSIIAAGISGLILAIVYLFLYQQYRQRYLLIMTYAWGMYVLRFVFDLGASLNGNNTILTVGSQLFAFGSGMALLWGTYLYRGRKISRYWGILSAAGIVWIVTAGLTGLPLLVLSIPTFTLLAFVFIVVGVVILRSDLSPRYIRTIVGISFILWGIHKADYPFLRQEAWFAPWGFLIGSILGWITALGFLLLYFDQALTERRRAEAQLKESAAKMQRIVENMPVLLDAFDSNNRIIAWNRESERVLGYTQTEILNHPDPLTLFFPDENRSEQIKQSIGPDRVDSRDDELELTAKDGSKKIVSYSNISKEFPIEGWHSWSVGVDITARIRAEHDLKLAQKAIDSSYVPIIWCKQDGSVFYANEAVSRHLGYSQQELLQRKVGDFESEASPENWLEISWPDLKETGSSTVYATQRRKDQSLVRVEIHADLFQFDGQEYVLALLLDISEREKAEQDLRESESRYSSIFRNNHSVMLVIRPQTGEIVDANPAAVNYYGYSYHQLVGMKVSEINTLSIQGMLEEMEKARTEQRNHFNFRHRLADGSIRDVEVFSGPIMIGNEQLLFSIIHDITDRRQTEKALEESEARFRGLVEASSDWVWEVDENLVYIYVSPKVYQLLGYQPDEILGKTPYDLMPAEEASRVRNSLVSVMQSQKPLTFVENVNLHKDGHLVVLETNGVPVLDPAGNFRGYRGIDRDITERKRSQNMIEARLQELEAVSRVSNALRSAETIDEVLPVLVDAALTTVHAADGAMMLYNPAHHWLEFGVSRGIADGNFKEPILLGQSTGSKLLVEGKAIITENFSGDSRIDPKLASQIPPNWGGALLPVRALNEIIGALLVFVPRPRQFTEFEINLLTTIMDIGGNTMHRIRLHEQMERNLRRLSAMHEIDSTITSSLDLRVTMEVILSYVQRHLNVDAADVLDFNPVSRTLKYANGRGFRTRHIEQVDVRPGEGLAGRALLERRLVNQSYSSGYPSSSKRDQLLKKDEGFVVGYAIPLMSKGQTSGVLEVFHRSPFTPDAEWVDFLQLLAGQAAVAIEDLRLLEQLQRSNTELTMAYDETIEGWSRAIDKWDKDEEQHTRRVTQFTVNLAEIMGVASNELVHIRRGALLHDIGKMGVADSILAKVAAKETLSQVEEAAYQKHPVYGRDFLRNIKFLEQAVDIPFCHHEHWDGCGYPDGLAGELIPLPARIFAVVDLYDEMVSPRPGSPAISQAEALEKIHLMAGTRFDPQVVRKLVEMVRAWNEDETR